MCGPRIIILKSLKEEKIVEGNWALYKYLNDNNVMQWSLDCTCWYTTETEDPWDAKDDRFGRIGQYRELTYTTAVQWEEEDKTFYCGKCKAVTPRHVADVAILMRVQNV